MLGVLHSRLHTVWSYKNCGWLGVGNDSVYVKSRCFDPFPFPDPPESLKSEIRAVAEELDAFRKSRQAEHPKLTLTQMYNVLEKLKAMEARSSSPSPLWGGARGGGVSGTLSGSGANTPTSNSSPQGGGGLAAQQRSKDVDPRHKAGDDGAQVVLTPDEERIKDEGLILILKELHERLDRLVFQAYGWPDTLTDEEILERLVALNGERAKEEASGLVRWLRPDYQIPRFAKGAAVPKTEELDLGANVVAIDRALPDFPKDRIEDSLAVEHALLAAGRPMDAAGLARGFKRGGKRIEPRIEQALTSLVRYGRITLTPDGRYLARRAA
ncbi:MAG: restriction endonuclease subunit [Microvirga sp.]|nr:restriction endonuclease subunit [Microvirga sp.]